MDVHDFAQAAGRPKRSSISWWPSPNGNAAKKARSPAALDDLLCRHCLTNSCNRIASRQVCCNE
jgi:hypothetical protein